jgi:predicted RNA-binding Zn-ribbon protein involved in translation (DUF1610 family)
MIYWIFFGVLAVVIIGVRFLPGGKYREMAKGHDHCASCRAPLKWGGTWRAGQYAAVCPKCGEAQVR